MCKQKQIITPATVCDHIVAITLDNLQRFFEYSNLQSLCSTCHRIKTNSDNGKVARVKDGAAMKLLCESE